MKSEPNGSLFLSMMHWMKHINWLGIDVALGAGAFSYAIGYSWGVPFAPSSYLLLVFVVWLIYAFDHLRDVQSSRNQVLSERRKFHARSFRSLSITAIAVLAGCVPLLILQPRTILLSGSLLAYGVLVYFLLIQLGWIPKAKEFTAALFYAMGILLVPASLSGIHSGLVLNGLQIFLLALTNLWIFSWFDREEDKKEGFSGLLNTVNPQKFRSFLLLFTIGQAVLSGGLILLGFQIWMQGAFLGMLILLACFVYAPGYWKESERFRMWGDVMFFFPLITLISGQL